MLIITDGWDELIERNRQEGSLLYQLLSGELLPFVSVILTSRLSASTSLHRLPYIDQFVELHGFNKVSIKEYIWSVFDNDQGKAGRLIEQLESKPSLESVCSVPLNCVNICHLWHTLE